MLASARDGLNENAWGYNQKTRKIKKPICNKRFLIVGSVPVVELVGIGLVLIRHRFSSRGRRHFSDDIGRPAPKGVLEVQAIGLGSITASSDWAVEAVGVHNL